MRLEVDKRFNGREISKCAFANLPERKTKREGFDEEMKGCRWLKPKLVAQIEFVDWTEANHLRHPKFVGLRDIRTRVK
jgi:bifunctional non-homologous end joining protein LigD